MDSFVRNLRSNPTDAERHLWYWLRLRQLNGFKFRRQRSVGPYICDFVCLEALLIVELDGSQHVVQAAYDQERDTFLRKRGYRVLRFWNHDVLARTASVIDTIFEALHGPGMDGRFD
jgi:very-short-patch-repair endonuclease